MIYRLVLLWFLILFVPSVFAAQCLDVFPAGWGPLTPINNQLINFPPNGASATLTSGTTLNRGENLFKNSSLGNLDELYVSPVTGTETTARLFFTDAVNWQNVKINENGNPEDLIIVIDGSLQISGDSTIINAIIYVKGAMNFSGDGTINGAAAAIGSSVNSGISINYNSGYITNADFNGMCDNVSVDHFEIVHDGVGSTCDTEFVVVKACANDDCSMLSANPVTLDFQANGSTLSSPTFTGSSTLSFVHSIDEALTLSVANPSITPDNSLVCDDGSGNSCNIVFSSETCNPFAAWWQFEENFLDSSSSSTHNLVPSNNPIFGFDNPKPANTIGNESTCRYVSFDGSNYASIDDSGDFNFPDLSVSTWVYPTSYSSNGGLSSLVSKDEHFEFHINGSGKLYWWWRTPSGVSHSLTSSASIPLNAWTHVAVVYDSSGKQFMYINGLLARSSTYDDGLANSPCDFFIGTDVGTGSSTSCGSIRSDRFFKGHMDEVHIYDRVLTASEIQADLNVVHSCDLFEIDHFEIEHDGQGLTCEAESVTIKACANETCSTLSTTSITDIKLSINGVFDKNVTVSGGSTVTNFAYTDAATPATLSLDQDYECKNGNADSCDITFADTGFIFGNTSGNFPVIPTQLSGKPSDVGFNKENLFLQAVTTDDNSGSCIGVFPDGGSVPVDLSYTCHGDSSACSSNVVLTNNATEIGLKVDAEEHNLLFDADSKAYFNLNYPDAGKLIINAQKEIDVDGLGNIKNFSASSNDFVVRPFGFKLSFINDDNKDNAFASDALGTKFKKAGESFTLTATAMQWINGQDEDGVPDGVPDDFEFLNGSSLVAGHFADEVLTVTADLLAPIGGNNPAIGKPSVINSFVNSEVSNDYQYYEVGIIKLNASLIDDSYLGGGNIQGKITNVGRFIPEYFELTGKDVMNACNDFTYMDEPALKLTYELTAKNTRDETTVNYITDNDLSKNFVNSSIDIVTENNNDGTDLSTRLADFHGEWFKGVYSNDKDTVFDEDLGKFVRAAEVDGPYDNLLFGIKLTDLDGSSLNGVDMNVESDIDCTLDSSCNAVRISTSESQLRFGRWYIENAFGPETSDLPLPMSIQYWNGVRFITNPLDNNCTAFDAANLTVDDTSLNPGSTTASGVGVFVSGESRGLTLSAPGSPHQGAVPVIYKIPSMPWLQYDWSWNGTAPKEFDENPSATATFGQYRGNDRIIYQREVN